MILPYQTIRRLCTDPRATVCPVTDRLQHLPMIEGWVERGHHPDTGCSYGLGPSSYDVRIAEDLEIQPGEFVITSTIENFNMPPDVSAVVMDKSTYARLGVSGFNTYLDAGWSGNLTLELVNHGPRPVLLPRGAPILQVVFHRLEEPTALLYPRDAKYQNQRAGGVPALRIDGTPI